MPFCFAAKETMNRNKKHIFLNGFMGAGKSRIGPLLAKELDCPFFDTDKIIEQHSNKKIHEIFEQEGEMVFRKREQAVLAQLAGQESKSVIAVGGGALVNQENKNIAEKSGVIVYIKSSPDAIFERVKHTSRRPLLNVDRDENFESNLKKRITELLASRKEIYEDADIIIDRDGLEADQVCQKILERLKEKDNAYN